MLARKERKAQLRDALGVVSRVGLVADRGLWGVIAAARLLLDLLGGKAPRRASDAAARVVKLYDLSLKNNPAIPEPACRRGCAFCCHAFVSATAPEIFLVARHLTEQQPNDLPDVIARLRSVQERINGLDKVARHQTRQPCGLLVDGA